MKEFYFGNNLDILKTVKTDTDTKITIYELPVDESLTTSKFVGLRYNDAVFGNVDPNLKSTEVTLPKSGLMNLQELQWAEVEPFALTYFSFFSNEKLYSAGTKRTKIPSLTCNIDVTITGISADKLIRGMKFSYDATTEDDSTNLMQLGQLSGSLSPIDNIGSKVLTLYGKKSFSGMAIDKNTYGNTYQIDPVSSFTVQNSGILEIKTLKLGQDVIRGLILSDNGQDRGCGNMSRSGFDDALFITSHEDDKCGAQIKLRSVRSGSSKYLKGGIQQFNFMLL